MKFVGNLHIVGIVGIPGNYGGFETLVEHLVDSKFLSQGGITVYCEADISRRQKGSYKNVKLMPIRFKANGWQSIFFDTMALWLASRKGGVILVLGTSATFWLGILRKIFPHNRYVVNMAGLEWARKKWGFTARSFLKLNELAAARYAHQFIADNQGLVEYVESKYSINPNLIEYGGDQFVTVDADLSVFSEYKLPSSYDLAMARAQVDNNIEVILNAYASTGLPLVFVSNWKSCKYGRDILNRYKFHSNIFTIGPIYEAAKVKALRQRVRLYVHGHSAGGTNPVLVESMCAGLATVAFDVKFNRYTTMNEAFYFRSCSELERISKTISREEITKCGKILKSIGLDRYKWSRIRNAYEELFMKVI